MSSRTPALLTRAFVASMIFVLLASGLALAADASLSIESVGGQSVEGGKIQKPISGQVTASGTASVTDADGGGTAPQPLVADAGDSPFVASGELATLIGMAFGGSEPYTFAWSSDAGSLNGADAATAELDTSGLAAGTYAVSLSVTDSVGATASDTVKVVVFEADTPTLLDETVLDPTPGVVAIGAPGVLEWTFEVPANSTRITGVMTHTVPTNDYDLKLFDPEGNERAFPGEFVPNTEERATIGNPQPGTWRAVVEKFAAVADEINVKVTAVVFQGSEPPPSVSAGGPYGFLIGATQDLDGTVTGGTAPVSAAWDTDEDGVFETDGVDVTVNLAPGRHIVTLKATDADGLERRQTTSVLVADADRLAAEETPITVIGIADTGINPYHLEFSATTYPDPDVLALTNNFTRHPSEYIPGYPADAAAIPITLGQGYFPAEDEDLWTPDNLLEGTLYWIPGTKIIGAWDAGNAASLTEETVDGNPDSNPILDNNGHGSGSASVSAGNRYGYCPTCLLMVVEDLDETVATQFSWVDITSHSFGYIAGLPIGLVEGPNIPTREATERGQTVLFAAGNGIGNAFDVPQSTWVSDQTGPDWNITVGAIRRDNQRAVVGDGIPVHISAWGDGNLPSACRTGTVGQCAFGGTSAATPYTAGVFGTVLTQVRQAIGDGDAGQKAGQVVAEGTPIEASVYLDDGKLTRAELREAVLKTAYPLNTENNPSMFPYPVTAPYTGDPNVLFEGYGAATPEGAERAVAVLLGDMPLPERPFEDEFFALDRAVRDTLYGGYDRDGNGVTDSEAIAGLELNLDALKTVEGVQYALREASYALGELTYALDGTSYALDGTEYALGDTRYALDRDEYALENGEYALKPSYALDRMDYALDGLRYALGENAMTYFLHRQYAGPPGGDGCSDLSNEQYMDRSDTSGDIEICFESRITSVAAAYRPLGIFASTDTLDAPLPAGSLISVDLYVAGETPSVIRPKGVLVATDREIGDGEGMFLPVLGSGPGGAACTTMGEACWTHYAFGFTTDRHAFTGEQLTFQVQLIGARSWAFGYEGAHASRITIDPAEMPAGGLDFGATVTEPADGSTVLEDTDVVAGGSYAFPDLGEDPTGAGDHPTTQRVEVSVDDASFANPIEATLDEASGTWSAPVGTLDIGEHTIYARARRDTTLSEVASSTFTVVPAATVEWQIVRKNGPTDDAAWQTADGFAAWSFGFDTAAYDKGPNTIVTRVVWDGVELARRTAAVKFK